MPSWHSASLVKRTDNFTLLEEGTFDVQEGDRHNNSFSLRTGYDWVFELTEKEDGDTWSRTAGIKAYAL
jgi:hypothetical protein